MAVVSSQQSFLNSSLSTFIPKIAANKIVNSSYIVNSFVDSLGGIYYNQSNVSQGLTKLKATAYIHGYSHEYLASLVRFFGDGFRQDTKFFYINKTALPGLTPQVNNTAEALLTGLLLRVKEYESNSLISKVTVEHWKLELIKVDNVPMIKEILLVKLYGSTIFINYELQSINTPVTPNMML